MKEEDRGDLTQARRPVMEAFGLGRTAALAVSLVAAAIVPFAVFWFFHSAPPDIPSS